MKKLKLIPILLAFLCGNAFAQELPKGQILDFSWEKGLNTAVSDLSLPPGYVSVAENALFGDEYGSIVKRNEVLSYGSSGTDEVNNGAHRLYLKNGTKKLIVVHGDQIDVGNDDAGTFSKLLDLTSGNYKWKWVTWNNKAIGSDGYNQPVKTNGTVATYLGSCAAADAGSGSGPDGTYTYKISYYTASYEVLFNQESNSVTVSDNDISLSMIPLAPDTYGGEDVTGRKVYRTATGGSDYYLLSNGTIANNTATTLTDSDSDAQLTATAYPAGNATYTPPLGRIPVIHRNRLWFANNPSYPSRIYYGEDGLEDVFVSNEYFNVRPDDGDEITVALSLLGNLCIGKNNSWQYIFTHKGDNPSADWEISDTYGGRIGCSAIYSAVNSPLGIIFLNWDGVYKFNGSTAQLISDAVTPEILDISETSFTNCWGEFHKNIYYLAYTSSSTGSSHNDRVLKLDVIANTYSIDRLPVTVFCKFDSGSDWDVLYASVAGDLTVSGATISTDLTPLGTMMAFSETVNEVVHRRHSDFTGAWDDMQYIPTKWGGDANSPVLEIARIETIDNLSGTINALTGDINREDTDGEYISQVLDIGADSFDKLYWHETIPAAGGDVNFYLRSAATADELTLAGTGVSWSSALSNPSGSDASGITANNFVQYKIELDTTNIDYTPTVHGVGGYVVKLTYNLEGENLETSVPLNVETGWKDPVPGYMKSLRKLFAFYEGEAGQSQTLTLTFENWVGDEDEFEIDLTEYPTRYMEGFTDGKFLFEKVKLKITENSLNDIIIRDVYCIYDVEYPMEAEY